MCGEGLSSATSALPRHYLPRPPSCLLLPPLQLFCKQLASGHLAILAGKALQAQALLLFHLISYLSSGSLRDTHWFSYS